MSKIIKNIAFYSFGIILLVILFFWHFLDVRAGAIESKDYWLFNVYIVLGIVLIITVIISNVLIYNYVENVDSPRESFLDKFKSLVTPTITKAYFITTLLFGLIYMAVLPPLSAPDEISHYISAYKLSSQLMLQSSTYEDGHVLIRDFDLKLEDMKGDYKLSDSKGTVMYPITKTNRTVKSDVLSQTLEEEDYRFIYNNLLVGDYNVGKLAISEFPPVKTTPFAHLPQALGITLERVLNLNSFGLLYFVRIFNLLFFCILTTFTISKLPFYKEIYFGVNVLPMTLHLAASYSYDVFILSIYGLYIAKCLNLAYKAEKVKNTDIAILAILMFLVASCKLVYLPLAMFAFLIPIYKFKTKLRWFISALIVFVFMGLSFVFIDRQTFTNYAAQTANHLQWANEAGFTLSEILHSPIRVLKIVYNTFVYELDYYHITMLGGYLGNLDPILDISYFAVVMLTISLLGISFCTEDEELILKLRSKIFMLIIIILSVGLIEFSMLLAWTPKTSLTISGVQGRYFLPLLPISLMLLKNKLIVFKKNKNRFFLAFICIINAYALIRIFSIVCLRIG